MIGSKPPTQPYKIILPAAAILTLFCIYGAGNDFFWLEAHAAAAMSLVYLVLLPVIVFWGISGWVLTHQDPGANQLARVLDRLAWILTFAVLFAQFSFPVGTQSAHLVSLVVYLMIAARGAVIFVNYWRKFQEDRQG